MRKNMSEEVFKQTRKKITQDDLANDSQKQENNLDAIKKFQNQVSKETGKEMPRPLSESPFEISGNIPPEFKQALARRAQLNAQSQNENKPDEDEAFETFEAPPERPRSQPVKKPVPDKKVPKVQGSSALEDLLGKLGENHTWEKFEFPSKGKFYSNIPSVVHVRAMTGGEEQILATQRWVKKGKAIDMIFRKCIKEPIETEELLSVDRTNLLIFLRGISYTPEYDVEIKCPNCDKKFSHVVPLDQLEVRMCDDDFTPDSLCGVLPVSGFNYRYRLGTGQDEVELTSYRENRIDKWGDQGEDDTLLYRTALLLEEIEGVTMKKELTLLLKKLPIQDVSHLRNEINQPPFGVDTLLPILCPNCSEEFKIDIPMGAGFFFPRKKEEKAQV